MPCALSPCLQGSLITCCFGCAAYRLLDVLDLILIFNLLWCLSGEKEVVEFADCLEASISSAFSKRVA